MLDRVDFAGLADHANGYRCGREADGSVPPELSVVVPCYNEDTGLRELHRRLTDTCAALPGHYEIVLVNDGSRDRSWEVMNELAASDPHLVLVNLSRNHGHQLALTAGLTVCQGRRVLIIDADLQDPPELLPEMLQVMDDGADVVYGRRRKRDGETRLKRLTASLFYRLIEKTTDTPIPRDTGDFRLISRRALNVFLTMPERHRFIRGMISWIGFRQEPFLYDRHPRFAGTTKYPYRKMLRFAADAITAFSIRPLAMASWLGIVTGLCACLLLVYSAVSWLRGSVVVGWTSLMATIVLFGSVQMFMLGIFGEYLGRMYEQSKGRPLFIIEQVVRRNDPVTAPGPSGLQIAPRGV
jgi:glycosyltransferase involved in cell wall biosynthesis